jgi:hypothetical protein
MRLLPWVGKHSLEVDLFMAVRTCLPFSNYTPASNAKFVKPAKKLVRKGQFIHELFKKD